MSLPDDLALRDASLDDLTAIAAMREAVGWGTQDWALRVAIGGRAARTIVVTDAGGRIVGVGSGMVYGALGFVGNMIVDEAHRGRGIGAAILSTVTDHLEAAGCVRLELFATELGRPLYARHGFEPMEPGAMSHVGRDLPLAADGTVAVSTTTEIDAITAYDAPRFGGDRRAVLEPLVADPDRPMLVALRDGKVVGYAWLRAPNPRLGPFVADDPGVAAALVADAFARAPELDEIVINLPTSNLPGVGWLRSIGAESEVWDGRMGRGPDIPRRVDTIYGNAVGALG